jgi:circadian clock protein KaiC
MNLRISTGNREADEILHGGFPRNSINIIMGLPGTGKTVFAQNIVFHNAGPDRPILYLTTLSEPVAKVVRYLERFEFYDESKLATEVHYDDIGARLATDGIGAILPVIEEAIKTLGPKIIVIDSFKALHDLAGSVLEMRKMLFDLTGLLTAFDTTVFLLGEYTNEHAQQLPEFAVADGIVQFMRNPTTTRDERFLRVLKLRGSSYLEGSHAFRIMPHGLEVFPRLVSPRLPENYKIVEERISTGVPGLDKLLGGGLWRGSTTLVAGPTGGGKTTMALQFVLEGVKRGEPSLYANFQENPTQIARVLRNLSPDAARIEKEGLLKLYYSSPVELRIDSVIVTLFKRISAEKIKRVVIDAVGDLRMAASDPQRLHDYLYALIQHFTVMGVTTFLNFETTGVVADTHATPGGGGGRISYLSDNIVLLSTQLEGKVKRTVAIIKARGGAHDLNIHEMEITEKGVAVKKPIPL